MDPNASWAEIQRLLNQETNLSIVASDVMVEHAEALKAWIVQGGFLPSAFVQIGITKRGAIRLLSSIISEFVSDFERDKR